MWIATAIISIPSSFLFCFVVIYLVFNLTGAKYSLRTVAVVFVSFSVWIIACTCSGIQYGYYWGVAHFLLTASTSCVAAWFVLDSYLDRKSSKPLKHGWPEFIARVKQRASVAEKTANGTPARVTMEVCADTMEPRISVSFYSINECAISDYFIINFKRNGNRWSFKDGHWAHYLRPGSSEHLDISLQSLDMPLIKQLFELDSTPLAS